MYASTFYALNFKLLFEMHLDISNKKANFILRSVEYLIASLCCKPTGWCYPTYKEMVSIIHYLKNLKSYLLKTWIIDNTNNVANIFFMTQNKMLE